MVGFETAGMTRLFEEYGRSNEVVSDLFHPRSHLGSLVNELGLTVVKQEGRIQLIEPSAP